MEHELIEAINRQSELIKFLIRKVLNLEEALAKLETKTTLEELGFYNATKTMKALDCGKKTLYRLRKSHPEYVKKQMGQYYYNLKVLNFNPKNKDTDYNPEY